jgi:uncharacterized membrane protein (UPF0127 family)
VRTLLLVALVACSSSGKRDDAPTTVANAATPTPEPAKPAGPQSKVYIETPRGEIAVAVEVVATGPLIEKGLMYRQYLAPDAGMLFLMGQDKQWTFWMHNTLIPLDMIFIKKDMTIAGIVQNAEPKTDTLRKVDGPSLYVLEVNGGYTAQKGINAGAHVRFENVRQ